jgi:hypothetical protein
MRITEKREERIAGVVGGGHPSAFNTPTLQPAQLWILAIIFLECVTWDLRLDSSYFRGLSFYFCMLLRLLQHIWVSPWEAHITSQSLELYPISFHTLFISIIHSQ